MSKTRKYENYKIVVTYDNGDKEEINYKGINTSNYSEMLKLYGDVKKEYSDRCVVIDFAGVGSNGELNIFWTKKIENKAEQNKDFKEKDSIELIETIKLAFEILNERTNKAKPKYGAVCKEQDIQLHKIETFEFGDFKNKQEIINEKLKIFDELERIRHERRKSKDEIALLDSLNGKIKIPAILNRIDMVIHRDSEYTNKKDEIEYLSEEKVEEMQIMRKVKYNTEKERLHYMKQFTPKYDKVYYENGEIVCYNHGYGGKMAY